MPLGMDRTFRHVSVVVLACRVRNGLAPGRAPRGISTIVLTRVKRRVTAVALARRVWVRSHELARAPRDIPPLMWARARPCAPQNAQPRGLVYAPLSERIYAQLSELIYAQLSELIYARLPEPVIVRLHKLVHKQLSELIYAQLRELIYAPLSERIYAQLSELIYAQLSELIYASSNPRALPILSSRRVCVAPCTAASPQGITDHVQTTRPASGHGPPIRGFSHWARTVLYICILHSLFSFWLPCRDEPCLFMHASLFHVTCLCFYLFEFSVYACLDIAFLLGHFP